MYANGSETITKPANGSEGEGAARPRNQLRLRLNPTRQHQNNGPLFQLQDGTRLTKQKFVARVRRTLTAAGVDASQYSGHSFRTGAATVAAANGPPSSC